MAASRPQFEIYRAKDGWRWRLRAVNGEVTASGEAYATESGCEHAVERLREQAASAIVERVIEQGER